MKSSLLQKRADLVAARATNSLVRVRRSVASGWVNGYVAQLGSQWCALSLVSDLIIFNGFQVFRIGDVSTIEMPAPHASFVESALRLRKQQPPAQPLIDLTDLSTLLSSASAAFPLLTIHREIQDPDVCHIGVVQSIADNQLVLKIISPDGQWYDEPEVFTLTEITRIDFGGLYEQALSLVAGAG